MMPGVSTTRDPTARAASTTSSVKKYISTLVVHPVLSISTQPAVIPACTCSPRIRPSAGHMTSCSQRMSGRSPPIPRSTAIGVCACVLTRPGSSAPGSVRTGASVDGALCRGPAKAIRPLAVMSSAASRTTEQAGSQGSITGASSRTPVVTGATRAASAATGTAAARRRRRAASRG
jgi:hypothetical protein